MNDDYKKYARELASQIAEARTHDLNSKDLLFEKAENLIGTLTYLVKPICELEVSYYQEIKRLMMSDDKMSVSRAENEAKTTDMYLEWRKLKMLVELANEQVMMIKKGLGGLEQEQRNFN